MWREVVLSALAALWSGCADAADSPKREPTLNESSVTRVACVGDSITYGAGLAEPEMQSYPAVLARLLGPGFEVGNFGVSGATALRRGTYPYWDQPEFEEAGAFGPRIVVIMLGSNDTKMRNLRVRGDLADDLRALVDHFRGLPARPRVWLCLPPPLFGLHGFLQGSPLDKAVLPAIRLVAREKKVPLIDVNAALANRDDCFLDGVHPNEAGAAIIAQTVHRALAHAR